MVNKSRSCLYAAFIVLTSVLLICSASPRFARDSLLVHFLKVAGGSDAILIQAGSDSVLIDTGGLLNGYRLADYLNAHGAGSLKYVILTHMHPDHIGGAYFIVPKFKIAEILDNGQALDPKDVVSGLWYKKLARDRNNYRSLKHGDVLKIGDRAELEILRPVQTGMTGGNDASLVMKLKYGKFSCLLMGDLRYPGEKELLESGRDLKADILKVGHSGWKDATTQDFLDAVNPEAAVICVGEWGGPSKEILARLKEKNVKTYRTDAGDIVVTANKDGSYDIRQ